MRPWLRQLFVWLVVLALPVQGMAGVARLHCAGGPMPAAQGHGFAHGPAHAAEAHAHAGTHAHAGSAEVAAVAPVTAAGDDGASPSAHKCSACAACAAGMALMPAGHTLPLPPPDAVHTAALRLPPLSFIASGPERPPRSSHG